MLLEARRAGPVIVSYAQNAEDVRLWRVLAAKREGFYVDVGAGHPVTDSVTKLFYDAGWSGINLEPGPDHAALAAARPRDVTLEVAIAAERGARRMWISHSHPGLSSLERLDPELLPSGFTKGERRVRTRRLDDVLAEHARGRHIDFLKIDVEGAEEAVLESVDLAGARPTIVLVEAISPLDSRPTHHDWEHHLVDAGYEFAVFDGINRFYVTREQSELIPVLAYPITDLDRFQTDDLIAARTERALVRNEDHNRDAEALLRTMERSFSWRVTRPLRLARRLQRGRPARAGADRPVRGTAGEAELERAFVERLERVRALLTEERTPTVGTPSPVEALRAYEKALRKPTLPTSVIAWLSVAAVAGSYPAEDDVDGATRALRTRGPQAFVGELGQRFRRLVESGTAGTSGLEILQDVVVVDVSHTVRTDLHTGIQRVVRETLSRWAGRRDVRLAAWNDEHGCLTRLSDQESERLIGWREEMSRSGAPTAPPEPELAIRDVLVPLGCRLLLPEVPFPARARGLRGLVRAQVHGGLSVIGFDVVPIVAAETMASGMAETFCEYLSLVKHAERVSAISEASATAFRAFCEMVAAEGIPVPEVRAQPLPTEARSVSRSEIVAARAALRLTGEPVVLVVGSHEPRKNHLAILEAAERLWASGLRFELLMVGGNEWRSDEFRRFVDRLRDEGWPINLRPRVTDTELWSAYRLARFTVFPSLLEGFGLPVAESIAAGTPVITSSHGSMAEIAAGGGALLVDPRDTDAITAQMRLLLTDYELVERLRNEARARDLGSWDDYAREVWEFFTADASAP